MIMKIAVLLKSGPGTDNAERALQTASDMLAQGHTVSLFLMQEGVRFCCPDPRLSEVMNIQKLIGENIDVHVLTQDAQLRGIDLTWGDWGFLDGSYDSLISLLETCDRVVGIF
jgi:sulfur relay (sulfurtransferase) complex TusBCD TusD component (DsrE family)